MSSAIGQNPYLLLFVTCDEILPWTIEIQIKNHLVRDNNCTNVNIQSPSFFLQGTTNNIGLTFSVGDTTPRFTIGIGDTKYHS